MTQRFILGFLIIVVIAIVTSAILIFLESIYINNRIYADLVITLGAITFSYILGWIAEKLLARFLYMNGVKPLWL